MNLLVVKKATVRLQAVMKLIHKASADRLCSLLNERGKAPKPLETADSQEREQCWMDGLNAGIACGNIEIQDLDAAEVVEAMNKDEDA